MAPVSTIKEVFFPATTLSTPSSKLVSGTLAEWLEPRPRRWNNSQGWTGVWGRSGDLSRGTRSSLWTFHSPGLGGGDLPRRVRASLGTVHLPVAPLTTGWACFCGVYGFGHVFVHCPDLLHQKQGPGVGGLKFQSGMTWAGLILIAAAKKAYLAFLSWFFSLLASSSLLLNILKAISRRSL